MPSFPTQKTHKNSTKIHTENNKNPVKNNQRNPPKIQKGTWQMSQRGAREGQG